MRKLNSGRRRFMIFLLAVLMFAGLIHPIPASAAGGIGTDYIVKYKESAAWLMEDDSVPFDVVSEAERRRLRDAGLLEWYEPNGEMTLLDDRGSLY